MRQEIKDLWINALESGQYTKTTDILHDATNNAHCVMGVLCDLAYDAGVVARRRVRDPWSGRDMYVYGEYEVFGVLPDEVMEWAGLDACDPELGNGDTISEVNDQTTTGHADMAVLIKEYL